MESIDKFYKEQSKWYAIRKLHECGWSEWRIALAVEKPETYVIDVLYKNKDKEYEIVEED
jgi:hypothetical protein